MDSFFARNRLSAYLDGELGPSEAREVEAAMARDPELRAAYQALLAATELLRGQELRAPAGFLGRVQGRVAGEPVRRAWSSRLRSVRAEVWLVAAASLLVIGYAGSRHPGEVSPVETPMAAAPAEDVPPEARKESLAQRAAPPDTPPVANLNTGISGKNDGSLRVAKPVLAAGASPAAARKGAVDKGAGEKEPWAPAWEQRADVPQTQTAAPGSGGEVGNTAVVYGSSVFRYRVAVHDEKALKELSALAVELGGRVEDARGRPLASYPLEDGESRTLRVVVPSQNQGALAERLRELGEVQALSASDTTLYTPGADVPITVQLEMTAVEAE
jgi:hypothetical protein